jgi:chromosome segregation ATPase
MKTIFKFSVFIVLSFTAAVALMNWDSFKLFADTGKRIIEKKINEAQSMETKLNLLETKIQGLDEEILELKTEVVRRKVDVEYMERILTEKELAQANLKDSLESASALLERKRDHYMIGHRRYSFEDVARDAEEKMKLYKIQEETLNNLKRTLDTKQKTLAIAEQNVAKGEGIKAELNAKINFLSAQVERYKAKEVYAETVKTDDPTVEFKTLIGQTQKMLSDFETQLKVKDRLLDERIRLGGDYVGGIDYSNENASDSEDIAGEISMYFKADRKASVAMEE